MTNRIVGSNSKFALINFAKEIPERDIGFEVVAVEAYGPAALSRAEPGRTEVSIPIDIMGRGTAGIYGKFILTIDELDEDTIGMTWRVVTTGNDKEVPNE